MLLWLQNRKMRLECSFYIHPTGSIFAFANNKLTISKYVTSAPILNDGTNEPMNILIDCYLLLKKNQIFRINYTKYEIDKIAAVTFYSTRIS